MTYCLTSLPYGRDLAMVLCDLKAQSCEVFGYVELGAK